MNRRLWLTRWPAVVACTVAAAVAAALAVASGAGLAATDSLRPLFPTPPPTTPPPPGWFTYGVMMDPPEPGYAYAWNPDPAHPVNEWYPVGGANSAGHQNYARHDGPGRYLLWLPGQQPYGVPLVGGVGGAACKPIDWVSSPAGYFGVDVAVSCFDPAGDPVDAPFTASYGQGDSLSGGAGGYVQASQPAASRYVPGPASQHNSTHLASSVSRLAAGSYRVRMPGLGARDGHAQVTAYGPSSHWCNVRGWAPEGTEQVIDVLCFTAAGTPVDTAFALVYLRDTNVLLAGRAGASAYAWADQPATSSYLPAHTFGMQFAVERSAIGRYQVRLPVDLRTGVAHVTSYGPGPQRCALVAFSGADGVAVRCHRPDGLPVDAQYLVAFVS